MVTTAGGSPSAHFAMLSSVLDVSEAHRQRRHSNRAALLACVSFQRHHSAFQHFSFVLELSSPRHTCVRSARMRLEERTRERERKRLWCGTPSRVCNTLWTPSEDTASECALMPGVSFKRGLSPVRHSALCADLPRSVNVSSL